MIISLKDVTRKQYITKYDKKDKFNSDFYLVSAFVIKKKYIIFIFIK